MFNATPEQLEAWKASHGEVRELSITGRNGEEYRAYLREENVNEFGAAWSELAVNKNPSAAGRILIKAAWLAGDEELRDFEGHVGNKAAFNYAQKIIGEMSEGAFIKNI